VLPLGGVATGKLNQALLYGATVLAIEGTFDDALRLVRAAADEPGTQLVNSINPYRIEGQKTAAFEIIDVLDDAPDILAIPVGNAGNITAYWRGFREYREAGRCGRLPEMWGFQAAGAAPLALNAPVPKPETVASAIRIGAPARAQEARAAVRESRGCFGAVADDQILEAYRLIASTEGILCEPASAAPIAGLLQHVRDGHTLTGRTIVAVLTGNGLKDPDVAEAQAPSITIMPPDAASLQQAMRLDA
jgi:threonine synthase